jgi:hypothetical protein
MKKILILRIPQKTSREYILLSIFERKMVFSAIYKPKSVGNRPFFLFFKIHFGSPGGGI